MEEIIRTSKSIGATRAKHAAEKVVYNYYNFMYSLTREQLNAIDPLELIIDIYCDIVSIDTNTMTNDDYSFD